MIHYNLIGTLPEFDFSIRKTISSILRTVAKLENLKKEVFEASRIMGVTDAILNKKPSAGLWPGQTDEDELGVTYEELDNYLLGKEISLMAKERIDHLHRISEHKRSLIPVPEDFIRD